MIKPKNTAEGLIAWEGVTPEEECGWHHGRATEAWFQVMSEDAAVVQIHGALDTTGAPMVLDTLHVMRWARLPVPMFVRPKVISGTATILMQR